MDCLEMQHAIIRKYPGWRKEVYVMPYKQIAAIYKRLIGGDFRKQKRVVKAAALECPECFFAFKEPDGGHRECPVCGTKSLIEGDII